MIGEEVRGFYERKDHEFFKDRVDELCKKKRFWCGNVALRDELFEYVKKRNKNVYKWDGKWNYIQIIESTDLQEIKHLVDAREMYERKIDEIDVVLDKLDWEVIQRELDKRTNKKGDG